MTLSDWSLSAPVAASASRRLTLWWIALLLLNSVPPTLSLYYDYDMM